MLNGIWSRVTVGCIIMFTHTQTHTLCSLPAVRSTSTGPYFLSHTGQAAVEWLYGPWLWGCEGAGGEEGWWWWKGGGGFLAACQAATWGSWSLTGWSQQETVGKGERGEKVHRSQILHGSLWSNLDFVLCTHKNNHRHWIHGRHKQGVLLVWQHAVTGPKMWNETYSHPVAGVIGPNATANDCWLLHHSTWDLLIVKTGLCCDLSSVSQRLRPITAGIGCSRPSPRPWVQGKAGIENGWVDLMEGAEPWLLSLLGAK